MLKSIRSAAALAFGLSLLLIEVAISTNQTAQAALSNASTPIPVPASPTPGARISVTPLPSDAVTAAQAKPLKDEFQKALTNEARALDHRQKTELKELKASHAARQKEWENKEKETRHAFFKQHTNWSERRTYIRDFLDRRKAFRNFLADELSQRTRDQEARRTALAVEQKGRLEEFQADLNRGMRPSQRLWPASGN